MIKPIFPNESDEKNKFLDSTGVVDRSYYDPSELFNLTLLVLDKSNSNVLSNSDVEMKDTQGRVWMSEKTNEKGIIETTVSRFLEYEIVTTKESYSIKDTLFTTNSLTEEEYSRFEIPLTKGGVNVTGLIVDAETEAHIIKSLINQEKKKIIIIASHRLAVLDGASQIIVLDGGEIVAEGSHDELMQQQGLYARLAKLQFRDA